MARNGTPAPRRGRSAASGGGENGAVTKPIPAVFSPDDCNAGLPMDSTFHEVVFAEFKRLNTTIDDLPYPVLFDVPKSHDPKTLPLEVLNEHARRGRTTTILAMVGGVPLSYVARSRQRVRQITAPLMRDVVVADPVKLVSSRSVRLARGVHASLALSDRDVADVVARRSVIVQGTSRGKPVTVRLKPSTSGAQSRYSVLDVPSVDAFLRNPVVPTTDGGARRVRFTSARLKALARTGQTSVSVGRQRVIVRLAPELPHDESGMGPMTTEIAFATTTSRGPGLEGVPQKNGADIEVGLAPGQVSIDVDRPVSDKQLKLALYLPWRQVWRLKGYTRGELLHTLVLAPQEEATIEVSTWDRRKRTFEDSAQSEFEQSTDFTQTDKDAQNVAREIANQNEFGLTLGGQVGFTIPGVFNVGGNTSANLRAGLTNSSKHSLEFLRETISKTTSKLRLERQTKIGESAETGREEKVTRKLRNPNMCHALALNYYEILAHYDIETTFNPSDAKLCVLAPGPHANLLQAFTYERVRYYENVLSRVLLIPSLSAGFAAAKKLAAQDRLCEARARNELCTAAKILNSGGPATDPIKQQLKETSEAAVNAYSTLSQSHPRARLVHSLWQLLIPWPVYTLALDDESEFQRWLYLKRAAQIQPGLFAALSDLIAITDPDARIKALANALVGADSLGDIKPSAISQDQNTLYQIIRHEFGVVAPIVLHEIPQAAYAVSDAGLTGALASFAEQLQLVSQQQQVDAAQKAMDENQAKVAVDYSAKEIAEALESVDALVVHLNAYRNYYRASISKLMPFPDEYQDLLSAFSHLIGRQVIGWDGSEIAFPIFAESDQRTKALFDDLVTSNKALLDTKTTQPVVLPTSGVHMEGRLGGCSTCEDFIEKSRELDLDLRREQVRQARAESNRLERRLRGSSPLLDDPKQEGTRIKVDLQAPPQPPQT